MSWQIINVEPAYGVCDQCKQHTCGIVDGKHKWVQTGIYDRSGDAIVVGYRCVELWAENIGISLKVIEKEVPVPPTDEQIAEYVRKAVLFPPHVPSPYFEANEPMNRDELKAWLTERNIPFAKNLSDDKLRELVNQHVGDSE